MNATINLAFGFISDIDPEKGLVKVEFKDETDEGSIDGGEDKTLVSDWLPISVRKSLKDKETFPFDVNEHVWCIMDEFLEYGICCGALYNETDLPDGAGIDVFRTLFKDGSFENFKRDTGDRELSYTGGYKLTCTKDCEFTIKNYKATASQSYEVSAGSSYKASTTAGAEHSMNAKHTIKNSVYSLATILKDIIDFFQTVTYTNSGGAAAFTPAALPLLLALKAKVDLLLDA